jgi:hypothetical protein
MNSQVFHDKDKVIICQLVQKFPKTNDYFFPKEILTYGTLSSEYPNVLLFPRSFRLHKGYVETQKPKGLKEDSVKSPSYKSKEI